MEKTFSSKDFNIKLDIKFEELSKNLLDEKSLAIVYNKAVDEAIIDTHLGQEIIKDIKKLVRAGGMPTGEYVWPYWERHRKERKFSLVYSTTRPTFSKSWKYGSNNIVRYPVHPMTYLFRRTMRKKPMTGQFALIDTGEMLQGLYFVNIKQKYGVNYRMITNANLRKAEYGIGQPKRPVLAPIYDKYMSMDKSFIEVAIKKDIEQQLRAKMARIQ